MNNERVQVISYGKDKKTVEIVVKNGKASTTRHAWHIGGGRYRWQKTHPSGHVETAEYSL